MKRLSPLPALMLASSLARADYVAIGDIEGQVCHGFGVSRCETVVIHAVERDGEMHHIARRYEKVSDFRDGRCWIQIESRGWGLISGALNLLLPNQFYTKDDDGDYEQVDPEYLTFRCTFKLFKQ